MDAVYNEAEVTCSIFVMGTVASCPKFSSLAVSEKLRVHVSQAIFDLLQQHT